MTKKLFNNENIHVIVQLPAAAEPYWNDDSSVYEWIKQFKPNRGRNLLVKTYGKDFKFLQRDDTIKALWKGTVIAGIEARFKYRNVSDKGLHPIPILVGGPGVGKSRFLDEVERLLGQYANESDDEEIRKAFTNMTVINTTYGNGSPAGTMDVNFGAEASLAIRILYEYFRPNHNYGSLEFSHFQSHCYNYSNISSFTLSTALRIIYADVIIQKKQEINSNPLLVLVLGIDEFNKLHDTEKGIYKYSLELNSHWLTIPLAKAILGFPVKKMDTIMLNKISMSYQELSSMGVVNLVPTEERGEYLIRLPYVWVCAIVESSDDHGMMYLKFMMLRYDEPWQNFEDFNAKFWALRLRLFHLIGYKQIKLKTLFKGADFSLSFPDVEVAEAMNKAERISVYGKFSKVLWIYICESRTIRIWYVSNEKVYINSAPVESLVILGFNEDERNNIRLKRKGHPGKA
uniref:Crinkler family protein n=1 Tax=Rhizophagus irregularis (strain DAOM 181602 / DAOM 197198 / MUCL 43194) TaxID=747089 RepID=U9UIF4_RHIID